MGESAKYFAVIPFVSPKPRFVSATYQAPSFCLVNFDRAMDIAVTPSVTSLKIMMDGNPQAIIGYTWNTSTQLKIDFGAIPTVSGTVELVCKDVNLRSVEGTMAKPPEFETFYP